uniref:Uncharacterized protein n=1 Tax=Panagrellus redivivus TaxID=6233 RepID=A0A7E4VQE9_PANRE
MRQLTVCLLFIVICVWTTDSLECYSNQDVEWDMRKEEPKTNYSSYALCSENSTECIATVKPSGKLMHWMVHVGCGNHYHVNIDDDYHCEKQPVEIHICYCPRSHCNDFKRVLTYLRINMPTTTTALSTTTIRTTTTTVTPAKCYAKDFAETTLNQVICEDKRCYFMAGRSHGELMVKYGCMEGKTDNKLVLGCHTVQGGTDEGWGCFCYFDLCNSEEWVMAEIQKYEDEQKFKCYDYSTTTMNTSLAMEKVECDGPRQCTSYFQAVGDGMQYEGGCVDGLISDAFYEEDCFFDEDYPNGPLFICYCNKANCNDIKNFSKLAKSKNAYDWAKKHRNFANRLKLIHPALIFSLFIFWRLIFYD